MKQDGQFLLMTPLEFVEWFPKQSIKRKIDKIQIHHTAVPDYTRFYKNPDEFYFQKAFQKYAKITKGWYDIAQHLTIFPNGMVCTGRSFELSPAGIYNNNTGAICIENVGNFDYDIMTNEHKEAIVTIVAVLCNMLKISIDDKHIIYHAWFNLNTGVRDNDDGKKSDNVKYKTCPGKTFFGGHDVQSAKQNFFPLITKKINELNKEGDIVLMNSLVCKKIVSVTTSLNVREFPNTNSNVLGKLKNNDIIQVTGIDGDWLRIDYQGRDAFVHKDYVKDYIEQDYKKENEILKKKLEDIRKIVEGV